MRVLSYGYEKPQLDDTGDEFFPAQERNIQRLNDHKHDGTLGALNAPGTQTISSASWVAVGGMVGTYSQTVTLPAGYLYDSIVINLRLSTGQPIYPSIVRASNSTYTVYVNDNTLNLVAEYTT